MELPFTEMEVKTKRGTGYFFFFFVGEWGREQKLSLQQIKSQTPISNPGKDVGIPV